MVHLTGNTIFQSMASSSLESSLESFSLTHVVYTKGDLIGKLLALGIVDANCSNFTLTICTPVTLSPIFIIISYCSILMIRRDIQTVFLFLVQLLNVALNLTLKKIIKDPRPSERCADYIKLLNCVI